MKSSGFASDIRGKDEYVVKSYRFEYLNYFKPKKSVKN